MTRADTTPTDRLLTVRPITKQMPAVGGGQRRRQPLTGPLARVAGHLDAWAFGRLDAAALVDVLHAQAWPKLPATAPPPIAGAGSVVDRWRTALARALAPLLDQLAVDARPWREWSATPCDQDRPHELCARCRQQLYAWHDVLERHARVVLDQVPGRANEALGGRR